MPPPTSILIVVHLKPSLSISRIPDSQTHLSYLHVSMCKSKKSTDVIRSTTPKSRNSRSSSVSDPSSSNPVSLTDSYSYYRDTSRSSAISSRHSLSTLKDSLLPENPHIYDLSEIRLATNNFLLKPFSSSSSSTAWRCVIRGKDVVLFQRKFRRPIELPELQRRLLMICRSHHSSIIKLLGAAASGNYIYLVYEFYAGANLATCLRNPKNPNFTVLSSWLSRMQVATDLGHGLDYIHHCLDSNFVHNHITSSSVIVSEESMNAKICHFGTAELCGELVETKAVSSKSLTRVDSKEMKIEGKRGYMAPEFPAIGGATQKCDVYSFGVVILELLSGREAMKYAFDEVNGTYKKVNVIDSAREAIRGGGGGVRRWVDRRLKDSFPVEVAEKMVVVGLECVEENPEKRPDMGQVAVRISKLYLESKNWAEKIGLPIDFSMSIAPR